MIKKRKPSRVNRANRRAKERGLGVVTAADLRAVCGMLIDELWSYAQQNRLRVKFGRVDGVKEPPFDIGGVDVLVVDVDLGQVVKAAGNSQEKVYL